MESLACGSSNGKKNSILAKTYRKEKMTAEILATRAKKNNLKRLTEIRIAELLRAKM